LDEWQEMDVFGLEHLQDGLAIGFGEARETLLEEGGLIVWREWKCFKNDSLRSGRVGRHCLGHKKLVGRGNDADEIRIVFGAFGRVVIFEDVDEGRHEIPGDSHPTADFAMVHAEVVAFESDIVEPVGRGETAFLGLFLENEDGKRKLADVVKQAAKIGLFFFKIVDLAGDTLAEQRRKKTMLPECHELCAWDALSSKLHERTSENEGAQTFRAEEDGGLLDAEDTAAQSEQGGVAQTENLSAEAGVGANDFTDLFQVDGGTAEERVEIQDVGRESGKILAENGSKAFLAAFLFYKQKTSSALR